MRFVFLIFVWCFVNYFCFGWLFNCSSLCGLFSCICYLNICLVWFVDMVYYFNWFLLCLLYWKLVVVMLDLCVLLGFWVLGLFGCLCVSYLLFDFWVFVLLFGMLLWIRLFRAFEFVLFVVFLFDFEVFV